MVNVIRIPHETEAYGITLTKKIKRTKKTYDIPYIKNGNGIIRH